MTKEIYHVKEWNNKMISEGKYIMAFTVGTGSIVEANKQRGYVVHYGKSAKWFSNRQKAIEFLAN